MKNHLKTWLGGLAVMGVALSPGVATALPAFHAQPVTELGFGSLQERITVRGNVTSNEDGDTLPGVSVQVKGTILATSTDENGNYVLENVPANGTLVFTMVGMFSQEVPVSNQSTINVVLHADISGLDEVVVIGYGTQKKATKTGAIAQVKGEDLQQSPVVNVTNTLAGRIPGVMGLNTSGEPGGDGSQILIRGRNTLNKDNAGPLIVIDGIPDRGGMGNLDANDIETVTVLKDAQAAIYGSRSANGVIVITTKRGRSGDPRINYNFNQGFVKPTKLPEMADAALYSQLQNEILEYGGSLNNGQTRRYRNSETEAIRGATQLPIGWTS